MSSLLSLSTGVTRSPLSPVQEVPFPAQSFTSGLQPASVLTIVLILIFLVWVIFTFVFVYHWFKYGHTSRVAIPSLTLHLFVSAGLFLLALSSFA